MNLCFSGYVLLAGLFLSVSALTPEECQTMVTPLSLDDHSMLLGRYNALVATTDSEAMNQILKVVDSTWLTFSASTDNPNEVLMSEQKKMNGQCYHSIFKMSIDGSVIRMSDTTWSSESHLLPSTEGCITFSSNTTASGFDQFFQMLNINSPIDGQTFHYRAVYLLCREATLKDSVLEHFKQQASCLGFSGELSFLYHPNKGFCSEGEGIMLAI